MSSSNPVSTSNPFNRSPTTATNAHGSANKVTSSLEISWLNKSFDSLDRVQQVAKKQLIPSVDSKRFMPWAKYYADNGNLHQQTLLTKSRQNAISSFFEIDL